MKYSSYQPAAVDPEDSEEEEEDERCGGLGEYLPHSSCCLWFFIVVIAAMLVSEVLAWLRQPSCGGHSHFEWNQVIPANTVNQIERGNMGSMLQEYDILGDLDTLKSSCLGVSEKHPYGKWVAKDYATKMFPKHLLEQWTLCKLPNLARCFL